MMTKPPTKGKARKAAPAAITSIAAPVTPRTVKLAHLLARITAEHINTLPKAG